VANESSSIQSPHAEPAQPRLVAGLQCRIGRARVAVAVEAVARIIEYQVVRLPLARPWIGGLGIHEGVPLLSVALVASDGGAAPLSSAKGILLNVPGSPIGWALEIHEVFAFVRATVLPRRDQPGGEQLPRWITGATIEDGTSLGWIDVGDMVIDLTQSLDGTR
jgi:chemotaxis signal transduction protein